MLVVLKLNPPGLLYETEYLIIRGVWEVDKNDEPAFRSLILEK